jgi:hypothetical protein
VKAVARRVKAKVARYAMREILKRARKVAFAASETR